MTHKNLITIVLDKSGSMAGKREATIKALNEYIDSLRNVDGDNRISLVTFSSQGYQQQMVLNKVLVAENLRTVRRLDESDMHCGGGTPLLSAVYNTIQAVERSMGGRKDIRPIIVIQTDGEENTSIGMTHSMLKSLIQEKEAAGWEFVFMGCGVDAYADGMKMGFASAKVMSYGEARSAEAFRATSEITASYLSGSSASMNYSRSHKTASGDVFDPEANSEKEKV